MIKLDQTKSRLIDIIIRDTSRRNFRSFTISHYAKVLDINPKLFDQTVSYLEEVCLIKKSGADYTWGDNKVFLRKEKQSYYLHL